MFMIKISYALAFVLIKGNMAEHDFWVFKRTEIARFPHKLEAQGWEAKNGTHLRRYLIIQLNFVLPNISKLISSFQRTSSGAAKT